MAPTPRPLCDPAGRPLVALTLALVPVQQPEHGRDVDVDGHDHSLAGVPLQLPHGNVRELGQLRAKGASDRDAAWTEGGGERNGTGGRANAKQRTCSTSNCPSGSTSCSRCDSWRRSSRRARSLCVLSALASLSLSAPEAARCSVPLSHCVLPACAAAAAAAPASPSAISALEEEEEDEGEEEDEEDVPKSSPSCVLPPSPPCAGALPAAAGAPSPVARRRRLRWLQCWAPPPSPSSSAAAASAELDWGRCRPCCSRGSSDPGQLLAPGTRTRMSLSIPPTHTSGKWGCGCREVGTV